MATVLLALASFVYALAWFLPVHRDGISLAKGGLPGWEALMVALSLIWDPSNWGVQALLGVLSGLTNVWFLVSVAALTVRPIVSPRVLRWSLLLATLVNAYWLIHSLEDLRVGYYLWLTAFPLLACACWAASRARGPDVSPRAVA